MTEKPYELDTATSTAGGRLARTVVRVGPTGDQQESTFMNATLQRDESGEVEYSIAMHVKLDASKLTIPVGDRHDAVDRIAHRLESLLSFLASQAEDEVEFEAEVGWADSGPDEDDEEQAERAARTDLCEGCKPVDHPTCPLEELSCSCCRATFAVIEGDG